MQRLQYSHFQQGMLAGACSAQALQEFVFIIIGMLKVVEVLIIGCLAIASFLFGHLICFEAGRNSFIAAKRQQAIQEYIEYTRRESEQDIDQLSRQALAFSSKQKQWIKVYDAESE